MLLAKKEEEEEVSNVFIKANAKATVYINNMINLVHK